MRRARQAMIISSRGPRSSTESTRSTRLAWVEVGGQGSGRVPYPSCLRQSIREGSRVPWPLTVKSSTSLGPLTARSRRSYPRISLALSKSALALGTSSANCCGQLYDMNRPARCCVRLGGVVLTLEAIPTYCAPCPGRGRRYAASILRSRVQPQPGVGTSARCGLSGGAANSVSSDELLTLTRDILCSVKRRRSCRQGNSGAQESATQATHGAQCHQTGDRYSHHHTCREPNPLI